MRKLLLFLLLFPVAVYAGGFKVNKPKKIQQPPGTIERVSKRGAHTKVFEKDHIGSGKFMAVVSTEPIHYKDDSGVWQEYKFDIEQDTVEGFQVVRTGKFDLAYDSTGRIRYQKKDASLMIIPAFDRTNVDMDFLINQHGLKAKYILNNASAPSTLKWVLKANDTVEEQPGGKGKGHLKKAGKVKGLIAELTAVDANGKALDLAANYKEDSLIVTISTAGAVFPITIDPSIKDTVTVSGTGSLVIHGYSGNSVYLTARNSETATFGAAGHFEVGDWFVDPTYYNYRAFIRLPMGDLDGNAVETDSVVFEVVPSTHAQNGSARIVEGTFSGAVATGWYNDFAGWESSGAYSPVYYSADSVNETPDDYVITLNQTGEDSVLAKMGEADTLRIVAISDRDISGDAYPGYNDMFELANVTVNLYVWYFFSRNPPGLSTVADTLKAAANLVGEIDSLGGDVNLSVRGFKLWPKGGELAADTITISESGSYGLGEFALYADSLYVDTTYYYKAFGTNDQGTSYGSTESFSTVIGSGGVSTYYYIDGRQVTHP